MIWKMRLLRKRELRLGPVLLALPEMRKEGQLGVEGDEGKRGKQALGGSREACLHTMGQIRASGEEKHKVKITFPTVRWQDNCFNVALGVVLSIRHAQM